MNLLLEFDDWSRAVMADIRTYLVLHPDADVCSAFNHHKHLTHVAIWDANDAKCKGGWSLNFALESRSNAALNQLKTQTIDFIQLAGAVVKVFLRDGERFTEHPGNEEFMLPAFHLSIALLALMETTNVTEAAAPYQHVALDNEVRLTFIRSQRFYGFVNTNRNLSALNNRRNTGPHSRYQDEVSSAASELEVLQQLRHVVPVPRLQRTGGYIHENLLFLRLLFHRRTLVQLDELRLNSTNIIAVIVRLLRYFDSNAFHCYPLSTCLTRVVYSLNRLSITLDTHKTISFNAFNFVFEYELSSGLYPDMTHATIADALQVGRRYGRGELDLFCGSCESEMEYRGIKCPGLEDALDGLGN